jgi:uncharacterized Ntn-hydrolase superfamily protein
MLANTFSIVARCQRSGMLGVGVSTAVPAVGGLCPHVRAGVGAIATQAWVNPYLGIEALRLLAGGKSPQQALDAVLAGDDARALVGRWPGRARSARSGSATGADQATQCRVTC